MCPDRVPVSVVEVFTAEGGLEQVRSDHQDQSRGSPGHRTRDAIDCLPSRRKPDASPEGPLPGTCLNYAFSGKPTLWWLRGRVGVQQKEPEQQLWLHYIPK